LLQLLKMKKIKVNNIKNQEFEVSIKESLSWGEQLDIEDEIIKGAEVSDSGLKSFDMSVVRKQKYKLLDSYISEIKNDKGEVIKFSKEWVDSLTSKDGDKLYNTIDSLNKKKD